MKQLFFIISLLILPIGLQKTLAYNCEADYSSKKTDKQSEIHCLLTGSVMDIPECNYIALARYDADLRISDFVKIPVEKGRFSYEFVTGIEDAYQLILWNDYMKGSWNPIPFIVQDGKVNFVIYPRTHNPHFRIQTDTPLNNELDRVERKMDSLFIEPLRKEERELREASLYETDEFSALRRKFEKETDDNERRKLAEKAQTLYKSGEALKPEYVAFNKKYDREIHKMWNFLFEYSRTSSNLVGLYLMRKYIQYPKADIPVCVDVFRSSYEKKFPTHPLTKEINLFFVSREIKVGNSFLDFTAPDLSGTTRVLSKEIKGKVALIDLWASWCGPCRALSKTVIPLYDAYKDKGFTVVGVARERNNTDAMVKAIEKDQYPWLNLVDLDDQCAIWQQYGVGNAGGRTFLVDRDGKILAIHPTAEEIETILKEKLEKSK